MRTRLKSKIEDKNPDPRAARGAWRLEIELDRQEIHGDLGLLSVVPLASKKVETIANVIPSSGEKT